MLQMIENINSAVNNFIWGVPAMICIFGVGLYLSIRTGFLQIFKFPYAIRTTPAMFPVPTVAARAVQTAWKGVRAPSEASRFRNMRPMVVRMA